ncbi:nitrile hydratase accessory protein [Mycobacterium adipatum]|uniref:Nitrile hydratase accessory protein n=2 Tax=Mycobacterium adipatum TaxID=1682113 RepID=A0A172UTH6_9MYCO|nr:nitrile hydratase accessory protein [Mycobacterium adipatum]
MMTAPALDLTGLDELGGAVALPRSNGELIFDAPWQGRLFGLVVHMCQSGRFVWDDFKKHLIDVIDASGVDDVCDPSVYYRQFGEAFTRLVAEKGYVSADLIEERSRVEADRLSHNDHDHDHDHDHGHRH